MDNVNAYLHLFAKVAQGTCILLTISGCQWLAPASRDSAHQTVETPAQSQLDRENENLRQKLDAIELKLAKKNAELARAAGAHASLVEELRVARKDIEYVEKQFVSIERGLTRDETRASAVSAIAESQLLFERLGASADTRPDRESTKQYEARMKAANQLVKKSNYPASVYYAQRAMRILNRMERVRNASLSGGETLIIAVSMANLRSGPGQDFDVLEKLAYGSALVKLKQKNSWTKVRSQSGKTGWIYSELIR